MKSHLSAIGRPFLLALAIVSAASLSGRMLQDNLQHETASAMKSSAVACVVGEEEGVMVQ